MAKEWANKDRYNPSHGVPRPRMPLPRGKAVVRSVPAWGDANSRSRGAVLKKTQINKCINYLPSEGEHRGLDLSLRCFLLPSLFVST
jgi:hypothetical protein